MADENRFEGAARQVGGAVKQFAGDVTGDTKTQAEGTVDKVAGKAQRVYGQAKDTVQDYAENAGSYGSAVMDQFEDAGDYVAEQIESRPVTAVLIAAGIGFLVALLTKPARRSYR